MKDFFLWGVTTIIKDVSGALIPGIVVIGLLVIVVVNVPDYFATLFFSIAIGVIYTYAKFIR